MLSLQGPSTLCVVPEHVGHVEPHAVQALVDFHEGLYQFPAMAVDMLGDDEFIGFVSEHLKGPSTRLDTSRSVNSV